MQILIDSTLFHELMLFFLENLSQGLSYLIFQRFDIYNFKNYTTKKESIIINSIKTLII